MEGLIRYWRRIPLRWRVAGPLLLLALALLVLFQSRPDGHLHLYFLPIGQGNAILLVSPSGKAVLIDGGPEATALLDRLGRLRPFWKPGLDLVLLSEVAPERLAGPVAVVERYPVQAAGRPGRRTSTPALERWEELLAQAGVEVLPLLRGIRLDLGDGVVIEVLHPGPTPLPRALPGEGDDALVLRVCYGDFRALLPPAAGPAAQEALLAEETDLRSTVLLVPRQAGKDALEKRFLEAVHPALAVVSAETGYHVGPDARTLALVEASGIPLYRTDRQGTVEVITDGQTVKVRIERQAPSVPLSLSFFYPSFGLSSFVFPPAPSSAPSFPRSPFGN